MKDYYKLMGLETNATEADIKKAYRKLALKLHPDSSEDKNSHKEFSELQEAYKILSNPVKRREYDRKQNFDFLKKTSGNCIKIGRVYFDKEDIAQKGREVLNTATCLIKGFFNKG